MAKKGQQQRSGDRTDRPAARLAPDRTKSKSLFGIDKGRIEILGDIIEPMDVEWEAVTREDAEPPRHQ